MPACFAATAPLAAGRSVPNRRSLCMHCSYLPPEALEDALATAVAASSARGAAQITDLDLSSCGLQALPAGVAALAPSLLRLTAKYNWLASLPLDVLGRMERLQGLDLEGNCVAALGEGDLARLPLRHLNLSANCLQALPASIAGCRSLEVLVVANNPLRALPDSLGDCPALLHLDVSGCRLLALPASLARSRSLQRLFAQVRRVAAGWGWWAMHWCAAGQRCWQACWAAAPPGIAPLAPPRRSSTATTHSEQRAGQGAHVAGPPAQPARAAAARQPPGEVIGRQNGAAPAPHPLPS